MMHDEGSFQPRSFQGGSLGEPSASGEGAIGGSLGIQLHGQSSTGGSLRAGSRNSPYAPRTPTARTPGGTILHETEHGQFLADRLEFIVPPQLNAIEREVPPTGFAVFMGHMRFETTAAEVRWLIRRLTGVTPVKAEPRSKGCFLVHLASEADENAVRQLHRRILMDRTGMWVARDATEAQRLSDYIEHVLNVQPKRRLRLPKDCVTVETPHGTPNPHQQQPPQQQQGVSSPPRSPHYDRPPSQNGRNSAGGAPPPPPYAGPYSGSPTMGYPNAGTPTFGRGNRPPSFGDHGAPHAPQPYVSSKSPVTYAPPPPYSRA